MNMISNKEAAERLQSALRWIDMGAVDFDGLAATLTEVIDGIGYMWCGAPYAIVADGKDAYAIVRAPSADQRTPLVLAQTSRIVGNVRHPRLAVELAVLYYIMDVIVSDPDYRHLGEVFRQARGRVRQALEMLLDDAEIGAFVDQLLA